MATLKKVVEAKKYHPTFRSGATEEVDENGKVVRVIQTLPLDHPEHPRNKTGAK